ncbi:carbohydrate ABC transporter permease [Brachybacterium sacelli]|uniref:Multiple sugar transport system permease protein n=1 Tax=Brachybacterium sacelli TaxID=173364 RepID=A0ABS4WZ24_9MICO|nr:sugar ABC transporter permease [Brachybacterium sacelli]MBP2381450.1 multiple sugar transport system permease protein [Brachybacterium sacelli]
MTTSTAVDPSRGSLPERPHGRNRHSVHGSPLRPYAFLTPTLLVMLVLMVVPIVMVIWYSFQDSAVTIPSTEFVGLEKYRQVLSDGTFWTATANTALFAGISVIAHFIIGIGFATLLNSELLSPLVRAIFRTVFILPWLFTVAVVAVLWRMLLNPNGIVNYLVTTFGITDSGVEWLANSSTALPIIIFINIWCGYPFFMVSLLAGLQGIPKDLYEAARVDGAGIIHQFFHVTIPQLRPIILSMAILDFIWTTQQFALIWMTTGGGPVDSTEMLSTYTYKLAFSTYDFSAASASAVVVLLLSMILAVLYVRQQRARD